MEPRMRIKQTKLDATYFNSQNYDYSEYLKTATIFTTLNTTIEEETSSIALTNLLLCHRGARIFMKAIYTYFYRAHNAFDAIPIHPSPAFFPLNDPMLLITSVFPPYFIFTLLLLLLTNSVIS